MLAAALVALLAALAGIDARATYGARVTADEPQYLLTAQSIADDGDLDISDEIAAQAYLPYHEIAIDRQTSVLADGREISPHDPLFPLLLAAPMAVGGWVLAKLTIAVLAALTAGLTTWVAIRRFAVDPVPAAVVTGAAFAGLPLAGYGIQVYPEMAAALATLIGFAALAAPAFGRRAAVATGAAIVALPWLAVKYVPVAAVLAAAMLFTMRTRSARHLTIATLATAAGVYVLVHRLWYGGWTVYATGDHFEQTGEFSVVGTRVDLVGRSRRLVGLLADREFGLLAWSPVWLLLPVAVAVVVSRRPTGWQLWTTLVAAGWLNATFVALTMHGWWVPGRQLVVILPVATIGIARLVDRPRRTLLVAGAGVLGALNWVWLAIEASTDRRTLVIDFMDTGAPPYRVWRRALPSGIADGTTDRWLLAVWSVAIVALMLWAIRPWPRAALRRSATPTTPVSR